MRLPEKYNNALSLSVKLVTGIVALTGFIYNFIEFPERLDFIVAHLPDAISANQVRMGLGILLLLYVIWVTHSILKLWVLKDTPLSFFAPSTTYNLIWDPPETLQIITNPIKAGEESLSTRLPIFRLKNLSQSVIKNINVIWSIDQKKINEQSLNQERFKSVKLSIAGDYYTFTNDMPGRRDCLTAAYCPTEMTSHEYLAPQIDNTSYLNVNIPHKLYALLEIIFVSEIPSDPPFCTLTKQLEVKITFEKDGRRYANTYNVEAIAKSTKPWSNNIVKIPENGKMRIPPEIMLNVDFVISKK